MRAAANRTGPAFGKRAAIERIGIAAARVLASAALLAAAIALAPARADERIAVARAEVHVRHAGSDPGVFVDALFDLALPQALRDAVDHGIALYFVVDLEISRSRWYWFDKRLVDDSLIWRLNFSPLTRQYRLARGGLALPFDALDPALTTMRRINQWRVGDAALFDGGGTQARIRLRLDTSMLPKPFQVNALTDRDWTMNSDWFAAPIVVDAE
jgi:hypothetical protein